MTETEQKLQEALSQMTEGERCAFEMDLMAFGNACILDGKYIPLSEVME